jgi:ParB family chromosome partitioning protein
MARKNLLAGLTEIEDRDLLSTSAPSYPMRGASKSMIRSVNELARQADAYLEGEHIIELEPDHIDGSFVVDRMGDDEEQYQHLLEAIRQNGQNTPVLLRPHPQANGRFMVVFGHRRVRVAKELGRKVRAVVKAMDDKAHVIAQGQENSARANLTFIEKAAFAKRLEDLKYTRDVICSALASNEAAVSKMISVATRIPARVLQEIGSAPSIGRERWVELSLLLPKKAELADQVLSESEFHSLGSNERFERLLLALNAKGATIRKTAAKPELKSWASDDKSVSVTLKQSGKTATLALGAMNGTRFADWISDNLTDLYERFRASAESTKET